MPPVKGNTKLNMFKKDESTLPFFSFHPKTKLGAIIRIVWVAGMLLVLILSIIMSNTGTAPTNVSLFFIFADPQSTTLIYSIIMIFALIALALFKRMSRPIAKLAVVIVSVFILLTGVSLISSMINYLPFIQLDQAGVTLPDLYLKINAKSDETNHSIAVMRHYELPDGSFVMTNSAGTQEHVCPQRVSALKITASGSLADCDIEGEIYVLSDEVGKLHVEWSQDGKTATVSYASDSTVLVTKDMLTSENLSVTSEGGKYKYIFDEVGFGKIVITFSDSAEQASVDQYYDRITCPYDDTHSIYLHRSETVYAYKPASIYSLTADDMKTVLSAYPSFMFGWMYHFDAKNEGEIVIEPHAALDVNNMEVSVIEDGVLSISPKADTAGISGSITLYLNEKATSASASADDVEAQSTETNTDENSSSE